MKLPVALRGYRFAETDLLLDRLADELRRATRSWPGCAAPVRRPAPSPRPSRILAADES